MKKETRMQKVIKRGKIKKKKEGKLTGKVFKEVSKILLITYLLLFLNPSLYKLLWYSICLTLKAFVIINININSIGKSTSQILILK